MAVPEIHYVDEPISSVSTVPITGPGQTRFHRPCVRISLDDLQAGDVVSATGMIEVTQDHPYWAMTCRFLKVGETNSAYPPEDDPAYSHMMARAACTNIDDNVHHVVHDVSGSWVCPGVSSTGYYQFIIVSYAATSNAAWTHGDALTLDYGELTLKVHRAGS